MEPRTWPKRFWRQTVWADCALPYEEPRYRALRRFWYPMIDVLYMLAGWSVIKFGVPDINRFFPRVWMILFGWGLVVWAISCMVGVCIPRLWALEVIGKSMLIGQLTSYATALVALTHPGQEARGFLAVVVGVSAMSLLMRLSVLSSEWRQRRLLRRTDQRLEETISHRHEEGH